MIQKSDIYDPAVGSQWGQVLQSGCHQNKRNVRFFSYTWHAVIPPLGVKCVKLEQKKRGQILSIIYKQPWTHSHRQSGPSDGAAKRYISPAGQSAWLWVWTTIFLTFILASGMFSGSLEHDKDRLPLLPCPRTAKAILDHSGVLRTFSKTHPHTSQILLYTHSKRKETNLFSSQAMLIVCWQNKPGLSQAAQCTIIKWSAHFSLDNHLTKNLCPFFSTVLSCRDLRRMRESSCLLSCRFGRTDHLTDRNPAVFYTS